jgi:murein DD-endopeptidase MepM/ murein hydrolase activator NlpD
VKVAREIVGHSLYVRKSDQTPNFLPIMISIGGIILIGGGWLFTMIKSTGSMADRAEKTRSAVMAGVNAVGTEMNFPGPFSALMDVRTMTPGQAVTAGETVVPARDTFTSVSTMEEIRTSMGTWTNAGTVTAGGKVEAVLDPMGTLKAAISTEKVRLGTGTETPTLGYLETGTLVGLGTSTELPEMYTTMVPGQTPKAQWTNVGRISGFCDSKTISNIVVRARSSPYFSDPVMGDRLSGNVFRPDLGHYGVDLGGLMGDSVYAVDAGTVVYSGWMEGGWGDLIIIDHGDGWRSWYAHLSGIKVECGEQVERGGVIGLVGMSGGTSSGPHLHFELWNDKFGFVDPLKYLEVSS